MGGVLAMIAHLYGVEKVARQKGLRGEELRLAREQDARPMLNQIHEYLLIIGEQVLPTSRVPGVWQSLRCRVNAARAFEHNAVYRDLLAGRTRRWKPTWTCSSGKSDSDPLSPTTRAVLGHRPGVYDGALRHVRELPVGLEGRKR